MAMTTHGFMAAPLYLAAAGVLCAYVFYMLKPEIPAKLKTFFQKTGIYQLLENKYGVDWIYENVFARGGRLVGELLWRVGDRGLIDGLVVNGSWKVVGWVSSVVRWFQSGYLYQYALVMILGIFVLMSYFVIWPAK
jgi:NADH-quinone oxidoreductase subunit L